MHKLLVPFDNSDHAVRALGYVLRLAKENGPIALHIVYAHDAPDVAGEVRVYLGEAEAAEMQRQAGEEALAAAIDAAKNAGAHFTTEVVTGPVAEAIVASGERAGCDAIVMGTRGLGAVANLMMGSVATRVVHLAKVPVTLVK